MATYCNRSLPRTLSSDICVGNSSVAIARSSIASSKRGARERASEREIIVVFIVF